MLRLGSSRMNRTSTDAVLRRLGTTSAVVPAIWPLEIANAILAGERRKRSTPTQARKCTGFLADRCRCRVDKSGIRRDPRHWPYTSFVGVRRYLYRVGGPAAPSLCNARRTTSQRGEDCGRDRFCGRLAGNSSIGQVLLARRRCLASIRGSKTAEITATMPIRKNNRSRTAPYSMPQEATIKTGGCIVGSYGLMPQLTPRQNSANGDNPRHEHSDAAFLPVLTGEQGE